MEPREFDHDRETQARIGLALIKPLAAGATWSRYAGVSPGPSAEASLICERTDH
jgi:hypothetical protein